MRGITETPDSRSKSDTYAGYCQTVVVPDRRTRRRRERIADNDVVNFTPSMEDTMRASRNELPLLVEAGPASVRGLDWGGQRVAVVSVPAGTDFGPLLQGLPGDRCQCPHWGYVLKGRLRIDYGDREEILQAGDYYHMPAGHTGVAEEDTEFLEVAPPDEHQRFVENARRVLA